MVDTFGNHATVFVAPDQPAVVSRLDATTNHRLDLVEYPAHAARFNSVGRLTRLDELRADEASGEQLIAAMLQPPFATPSSKWVSALSTRPSMSLQPELQRGIGPRRPGHDASTTRMAYARSIWPTHEPRTN